MMARHAKRQPPGKVRIIGGEWRGRRLAVAHEVAGLRPTPDRVRETLFNWLQPIISGARCLDLFAGTGVLGLEALSRGADQVCFVERDRRLAAGIEEQISLFDAGGCAQIQCRDAQAFLLTEPEACFDIVFVDSPFTDSVEPVLRALPPLLTANALVYVERSSDAGLPESTDGRWVKRGSAGAVLFGLLQYDSPK